MQQKKFDKHDRPKPLQMDGQATRKVQPLQALQENNNREHWTENGREWLCLFQQIIWKIKKMLPMQGNPWLVIMTILKRRILWS